MFFSIEQWKEIWTTIRANKLRTALTAAGVFWGIFMLVIMLGFSNALESGVSGNFSNTIRNSIWLGARKTTKPYDGLAVGRKLTLDVTDVLRVSEVEGIRLASPSYRSGQMVVHRDKSAQIQTSGQGPEYVNMDSVIVTQGRFINALDMKQARKVAVLGLYARDNLFDPGENPIGATVRIGNAPFKVVGIIDTASTRPGAREWRLNRVVIPSETYRRVYAPTGRFSWMRMVVKDEYDSELVQKDVEAVLKTGHQVHPQDHNAFRVFNASKEFKKFQGLFRAISALTWVVGIMTLFAGALGVSNIMLISIAERTKEIGIRKALGATPFTVVGQVIQESLVLTGLSGYVGLVAGVGVLQIAAVNMGQGGGGNGDSDGFNFLGAPHVDLETAFMALGILITAGILAGVAPARGAAAIRPAEALADE